MTKLVNRAKMTTATTGTGTITLGSAVSGYQSFSDAGVVDADVVRYVIEDGTAWEIGTGTYTASGTTLSRTPSESSNADAAINLSGTAVVYVTASAADILQPDNNLSDLTNASTARTNLGLAIGTNVQAWDADLDTWATKTAPADTVVGTSDTQTLTNKTLTAPTITGAILNDGYTEEVFAVTGTTPALSPTNGSIQTWTLSGNSTPTAGTWAEGQSITLMVDDGSARTITWTTLAVVWKTDGGVAPTLNTTGFTVIALWKVGTTIYGARVGDA
jgi:hypothetical protein